ncbi:hypothetical protein D9613_008937 [Agrocybe pediades]|uniref:HMG box domain-containing protein n=1 Tax=Agrocybe pediades TaxID=84607 RepID=A0A8H4VP31_9AGAR|nr:hypothetical protein D9613_008937 [Agrocybe pediades]
MSTTGNTSAAEHIPRPPNCWLFYLYDKSKEDQYVGLGGQKLTKIIGKRWRRETKEVKKVYKRLAEEAKALHKLRYPDWSYKPVKRSMPSSSKKKKKKKKKRKSRHEHTPDTSYHRPTPPPQPSWTELVDSFREHNECGSIQPPLHTSAHASTDAGFYRGSIEWSESCHAWQRLSTDHALTVQLLNDCASILSRSL